MNKDSKNINPGDIVRRGHLIGEVTHVSRNWAVPLASVFWFYPEESKGETFCSIELLDDWCIRHSDMCHSCDVRYICFTH